MGSEYVEKELAGDQGARSVTSRISLARWGALTDEKSCPTGKALDTDAQQHAAVVYTPGGCYHLAQHRTQILRCSFQTVQGSKKKPVKKAIGGPVIKCSA